MLAKIRKEGIVEDDGHRRQSDVIATKLTTKILLHNGLEMRIPTVPER